MTHMFLVHLPHQTLRTITQQMHPWKLTCPLKRDWFNRKYIFQPLIFRGHSIVSGEYNFLWKKVCWSCFFCEKNFPSQRHVHVVGVPSIVIENGGSTVDHPATRSDPEIVKGGVQIPGRSQRRQFPWTPMVLEEWRVRFHALKIWVTSPKNQGRPWVFSWVFLVGNVHYPKLGTFIFNGWLDFAPSLPKSSSHTLSGGRKKKDPLKAEPQEVWVQTPAQKVFGRLR